MLNGKIAILKTLHKINIMKKSTLSSRHIGRLAKQTLLIISLIGFNYSAIAGKLVSNKQISQVAKIAKATGTHIKIYKEAVTINIYGNRKKTDKQIKNRVSRVLTKKGTTSSLDVSPSTSYSSSKRPPVLEGQTFHPPVLNRKAGKPPALDDESSARPPTLQEPPVSRPPALNDTGGDTTFY